MTKIGVLVPQSKSYPGIGKEFINGLKLQAPEDVNFLVEGIGIGDNVQVILEKIDKLVLQEDVNAIIGLVGDNGLSNAYEKVNELKVPTIFARMGAYPDVNIEENKFAFTLSYGLCDSLRFLGEWLPENGFKQVGVSGSFNDAGYGFLKEFEESLYGSEGEFAGHYTPPLNPREDEAKFLHEFYQDVKCDAVCQLYNGVFAEENIEYMESLEGGIKTPLFFMPFALNKAQMSRVTAINDDTYMVASWLPVDLTGESSEFENSYFDKHEEYPTVPAMLGNEAMLAIVNIVPKRKELLQPETKLSNEGVLSGQWESDLRFKSNFRIWKADKSQNNVKMIEHASSDEAKEYNDPFEGQEKGWYNAYLCY